HDTWPDPKVERRTFYLTVDAQISPDKPGASSNGESRAYLYPSGTELYGGDQQFQVRPYSYGVLNYRTAPVTSDMVLLGNPEVVLYLSIDNGDDADIELTLKDVGPDGVLFLQSGLLRASLRAIDKDRTYVDEVVHSFRKSEKLVPGEIYELRISLMSPIAHVVRQGHSLELTIGAPNPIPH
ncbi:CocE/NonD family hydrolase C-terminal non-catalytic domain-containing protein, partial [Mesorhizobium prunaredense]|uniref:CocE/NonD family hydrolase C-terminal non-catalytic domain-containing protein n=1 Tax=Mesorhizobium prunaredense TaxID=1631249 RepID=UPI002452F933